MESGRFRLWVSADGVEISTGDARVSLIALPRSHVLLIRCVFANWENKINADQPSNY
jgi:hypothetical protein